MSSTPMKASQIVAAIKVSFNCRRPFFVHGQPGAGKSDLVRQAAKELGVELRDVRASQLESVDLRGLPVVEDGRTIWSVPNFLPTDPESTGILFLDELNQANQSTQAASYQLILDRRLGDYKLPDGWVVVAAGNRAIDRAIANKMGSALKNRFTHIEIDVDSDEWLDWAAKNGVHPSITGYIRFRPANLNDLAGRGAEGKKKMEAALEGNAFATPRSWKFASDILLSQPDPSIEYQLLAGTVGEAVVADFVGFLRVYRNLPDLDKVIKDPDKAPDPKKYDPQTKYALSSGLAAKANKNNIDNVIRYIDRIDPEFQVMIIKEAQSRDWTLAGTKAYSQWLTKNSNLL